MTQGDLDKESRSIRGNGHKISKVHRRRQENGNKRSNCRRRQGRSYKRQEKYEVQEITTFLSKKIRTRKFEVVEGKPNLPKWRRTQISIVAEIIEQIIEQKNQRKD
jgi:hypothetical protein